MGHPELPKAVGITPLLKLSKIGWDLCTLQEQMSDKKRWIDLSIVGLCTVALLGAVLRSKFVFNLPFINYNHLLDAHGHFAFMGWLTVALLILFLDELLPGHFNKRPVYRWLLGAMTIGAWLMLIAFLYGGYSLFTVIVSAFYIILTCFFSWILIADLLHARLEKPLLVLAISSIVCWILSSSGTALIDYIVLTRSFDAVVYRDALFTYLHFHYNGFFSLAVFALLYKQISPVLSAEARRRWNRFVIALCFSVLPSLFLSYLWQDPDPIIRIVALAGTLLVWLSFLLFIPCIRSLPDAFGDRPAIRFLLALSMGSFLLKLLLQGFTIFPGIGNALFGNRPVVMGFLHMVFLGFLSLFILLFFTHKGWLDGTRKGTKAALYIFGAGILANEGLLIGQGLVILFMPGSILFSWLLWVAGIWLLTGAMLIAVARIRTRRLVHPS
jgi:hypothetical protein